MKDWSYTTRTVDVVKPALFVVPSGPVAETEQKRGFTVRSRGDTGGTVMHTYRCPVHGQFDAMVPRADVPDQTRCPVGFSAAHLSNGRGLIMPCNELSPWAGSRCGIGVSSGYVES